LSDPFPIDGFDNWLSGFINGECSFSIRAYGECCFYFEHTDKVVIDLIRKDLT